MNCPYCNSKIPTNVEFCPYCEMPISHEDENESKYGQPSSWYDDSPTRETKRNPKAQQNRPSTKCIFRSGPGPSYNQVGRLSNGDCVAIFEYQDVGGTTWGRIDRGWISMDYVSQDEYYSSSALEPDQYIIDTYVGGWVDDYNRDFCITISYNNGTFYIDITRSSNSTYLERWTMSGSYDDNRSGVYYTNGRYTIASGGEAGEVTQYSNGQGLFRLGKPNLFWDDYSGNAGSGSRFSSSY